MQLHQNQIPKPNVATAYNSDHSRQCTCDCIDVYEGGNLPCTSQRNLCLHQCKRLFAPLAWETFWSLSEPLLETSDYWGLHNVLKTVPPPISLQQVLRYFCPYSLVSLQCKLRRKTEHNFRMRICTQILRNLCISLVALAHVLCKYFVEGPVRTVPARPTCFAQFSQAHSMFSKLASVQLKIVLLQMTVSRIISWHLDRTRATFWRQTSLEVLQAGLRGRKN